MKPVTAIANLGQDRWPIHGKIRLGKRGPKGQPQALSVFRLTSPDEQAIRDLSVLYGGTPKPWHQPTANPPDQWEVETTVNELRVFVPPGGLSCFHEFWSGGGCVRRCDGITCEVAQAEDMAEVPCLCKNENVMRCKPHSRLKVILPEIAFGGLWAMESTGWSAAHGLAAMELLIAQLQGDGRVVDALLVLEREQTTGGRRQFVVPKLRLAASVLALVAGEASVGALHGGHQGMAELGPAPDPTEPVGVNVDGGVGNGGDWYDADSEIVDAEIVEVPRPSTEAGEGAGDLPPSVAASPPRRGLSKQQTKLVLMVKEAAEVCGVEENLLRWALSRKASAGATSSSKELDANAASQVMSWCEEISAGLSVAVISEDPPKVKLG